MRWLPQLRALALGHDELQNVQRILRTQPHLYRISGNTTALVLTSGTKFSMTTMMSTTTPIQTLATVSTRHTFMY